MFNKTETEKTNFSKKELQIKMKGVKYTTHSDGNVEDDSVEAQFSSSFFASLFKV